MLDPANAAHIVLWEQSFLVTRPTKHPTISFVANHHHNLGGGGRGGGVEGGGKEGVSDQQRLAGKLDRKDYDYCTEIEVILMLQS